MGLIKAVAGSAFSYLDDLWEDYIYCDSMDNETLVKKGERRAAPGAGRHASDNIITQGSRIAVNAGQTLIVVENGRIIDFTAETGGYEYRSDAEPSMFCGGFGEALRGSFAEMKKRYAFGGAPANDQRAYFVNTKEILNTRFGFGNVPYRDAEFDLTIMLQGFGAFSFRVADPIVFYTNISGNVSDAYKKSSMEPQIKAELQSAMLPALGELGHSGVHYDQITMHTDELVAILQKQMNEQWRKGRGIEIATIAFSNVMPDDESVDKIRELQESRAYSGNKAMLGARMGAAQANAMEAAAENPSGAVNGFVGMNMAQGAGGVNVAELMRDAPTPSATEAAPQRKAEPSPMDEETWLCPNCGMENHMGFCPKCGTKKPEQKTCPSCGFAIPKEYEGFAFCPKCGGKL